jgi:hypothetical protein
MKNAMKLFNTSSWIIALKSYPWMAIAWFMAAGIAAQANLWVLAFIWLGAGQMALFMHYRDWAVKVWIRYLKGIVDAEREGRERADGELLSRSEVEVETLRRSL